MVYGYDEGKGKYWKVKGAGGLTPSGTGPRDYAREYQQAKAWYVNYTRDVFG